MAARQAGAAKVLMLEKAPEDEFGGNARFSHTGFRFVHSGAHEMRQFLPDLDEATFKALHPEPYTREHFIDDLNRVTQGRITKNLAATLADTFEQGAPLDARGRHQIDLDAQSYAVMTAAITSSLGAACRARRRQDS